VRVGHLVHLESAAHLAKLVPLEAPVLQEAQVHRAPPVRADQAEAQARLAALERRAARDRLEPAENLEQVAPRGHLARLEVLVPRVLRGRAVQVALLAALGPRVPAACPAPPGAAVLPEPAD
jgi:hypothetical protein